MQVMNPVGRHYVVESRHIVMLSLYHARKFGTSWKLGLLFYFGNCPGSLVARTGTVHTRSYSIVSETQTVQLPVFLEVVLSRASKFMCPQSRQP
jgi:hypothetical protein